jgi:hypothetical protein
LNLSLNFKKNIKLVTDRCISVILPFLNEKHKFSLIYKTGYWTSNSRIDSKSGAGSSLGATENLRHELPKFLKEYNIHTMLDIPCGDFFWLSKVKLPLTEYIGADIVNEMIQDNIRSYGSPNRRFIQLDLLQDSLPMCDFVMIRDCLVHLTNVQIMIALNNILSSGSTYLAATYFDDCVDNIKSHETDRWRQINLTKSPFNLPDPFVKLDDSYIQNPLDRQKKLGVWQVKDLKLLS